MLASAGAPLPENAAPKLAPLGDVHPYTPPAESYSVAPGSHGTSNGTALSVAPSYAPAEATPSKAAVRQRSTGPLAASPAVQYKPGNTGPLVPRGALELLPGESVVFQLGALYLTTKRVILLAPSVVRSAFVRDIDAVGTFTERASAFVPLFGIIFLALSGAGFYAMVTPQWRTAFPILNDVGVALPIASGLLVLWGLFMLARYFFWSKRTLFVSVKGRPLITVSIADWNQQKLEGMDSFVNAFFGIKDLMTGELGEVES